MLRTAIIGSGASGLFCGASLSDSNIPVEITVYEQGPEANLRCDQVKLDNSCSKCDSCSVTSGLGGNALVRRMRLSTFPAGSGLVSLIGPRYNTIEALALETWSIAAGLSCPTSERGYGSILVEKLESQRLLEVLVEKITHVGNIRCQERVQSVRCVSESWMVETSKQESYFDKIIVAGGKCCIPLLVDSLEHTGVDFAPGHFEYGCRVEFPNYPENLASTVSHDHKLKVALNDIASARTYCWSYPGRSILVRNFGLVCLDGAHDTPPSSRLSFAVLVRLHSIGKVAQRFLQRVLDNQVSLFNGQAIIQPLSQFLHEVPAAMPFSAEPLDLYRHGSLAELFGEELATLLRSAILSLGIANWPGADDAMLLGPCIEKCGPIPILSTKHESTAHGLFFVGDCSGVYRGALQASIAGMDVANCCIEQ